MEEQFLITTVRNSILNNSLRNNFVISRYYNNPPRGGYQINEDHEYILQDNDDIISSTLLEIVTQFGNNDKLFFKPFSLKKLKLKKIKENDPLIETVCSICLDNYKKNEFYRTLECNHTFHKKCIDRWIKKDHLNCPMCRNDINI